MNKAPSISVIIPTLNEEKHLYSCLQSIAHQNYPLEKIEIIIVDDGSTDKTLEIAKKFNAKILHSGYKHIERSKSLGLQNATGELILLIDADIKLLSKNWLERMVKPLQENRSVAGSQAIYWHYDSSHNIYNRYCELTGVNDPFVYMLKKRSVLGPHEKKWLYKKTLLKDEKEYFLTRFSTKNLPTLGSQGYIGKKDLILKYTTWQPYFFHMDSIYELVEHGVNLYAMVKTEVEHDYVTSFMGFHKKLYRNIVLFYKYQGLRKFKYEMSSLRVLFTIFLTVTFIVPLLQSIRGYVQKPDIAWFLHPVLCFTTTCLYSLVTLLILFKRFKFSLGVV